MSHYIDTSVLAAYYCPEPLSERAEAVLTGIDGPVISLLTEVEFHSAVARKARMQEFEARSAEAIRTAFQKHVNGGYFVRLEPEADHYYQAMEWVDRLQAPLRTLDALHLVLCKSNGLRMVTADNALVFACREVDVDVTSLGGQ